MPNGTYGGVRGTETKVGQKTFVSRPTRLNTSISAIYLRSSIVYFVDNCRHNVGSISASYVLLAHKVGTVMTKFSIRRRSEDERADGTALLYVVIYIEAKNSASLSRDRNNGEEVGSGS